MHVGWEGSLGDHSVWSQTVGWGVEASKQRNKENMKTAAPWQHSPTTLTTFLCSCSDRQGAALYCSFSSTLTVFSWRVGTVFSQFMHTTHPFCKAVGSYASVIPPWENNTQDSECVRSCKPGVLKKSANTQGGDKIKKNFWTCSWFAFQQEMQQYDHRKFTLGVTSSHRISISSPGPSILEVFPLVLPLLLTSVCKLT